jgi:hypothetical protein
MDPTEAIQPSPPSSNPPTPLLPAEDTHPAQLPREDGSRGHLSRTEVTRRTTGMASHLPLRKAGRRRVVPGAMVIAI